MNTVRFGLALAMLAASATGVAKEPDLHCRLQFVSQDWSAVYASGKGEGTVSCDHGVTMPVTITAKGVGLTAGKWRITDGRGRFTHASRIEDTLGHYLSVGGNAGLAKAGTAQVLTKGRVSLALAGKGEGFDLGIAVTEFVIEKRMDTGTPGKQSTP